MTDNMFTWFEIAIAAYLLYGAVRGKGQLFENPHVKGDRKKYVKNMRILSILTGVLILTGAVLRLTGVLDPKSALGWILWALGLLCIIGLAVYNVRMTDRKAAQEAQKSAAAAAKPQDRLRAAFVFDDEEETARKNEQEKEQNGNE